MVLPTYIPMSNIGESQSASFWAQKLSKRPGILVDRNRPSWPVRMAATMLAAHWEGLRFPCKTTGVCMTHSLPPAVSDDDGSQPGATDMPWYYTPRDSVSWISTTQLKSWEALCSCRKLSTSISKIPPKQPEKRRKRSQLSRACAKRGRN